MGFWLFVGGFCAVALLVGVIYYTVRKKIRGFSSRVFGNPNLLRALESVDSEAEHTPRSLNGCDSLLMPQILKDFPDFDVTLAKTYVREELQKKFGYKDGFTVYNVVIARYLPSAVQKTIQFQASVSWREGGKIRQMRFDLHYTYLISSHSASVAANCPNCGGALGYGETECPYCGSRVTNVLGNVWKFTQVTES